MHAMHWMPEELQVLHSHLIGCMSALAASADSLRVQPKYAGPGDLAGKLQGLPLLQSIGNRTFNPQFKPIIVPPPLVKPADFYDARNDPNKYSCEVNACRRSS